MGSSDKITSRLRRLRKRTGLSMRPFAHKLGYRDASSWQRYEDPNIFTKSFLPAPVAERLARNIVGLGSPPVTEEEIWQLATPPGMAKRLTILKPDVTGTGKRKGIIPDSKIRVRVIPEKRVAASGGGGSVVDDEGPEEAWHLPASYADSLAPNHRALVIIEVVGDSMSPTLSPGDKIMVDMEDRDPRSPGIFVIRDGDVTLVKRIEHIPGSKPAMLALISDNAHHGRYQLREADADIVGRVVWRAHRLS